MAKLPPKLWTLTEMWHDDRIQHPCDERLYSIIVWLSRCKDKRCYAGNNKLAEYMGGNEGTMTNSLNRLETAGYIKREFSGEGRRTRTGIIPLFLASTPEMPEKFPEDKELNEQIKSIFLAFQDMNSLVEFKNKTQRARAADLIRKFGFETVMDTIRIYSSFHGSEFCPVIENPVQLAGKWQAFQVFLKRTQSQSNSQPTKKVQKETRIDSHGNIFYD